MEEYNYNGHLRPYQKQLILVAPLWRVRVRVVNCMCLQKILVFVWDSSARFPPIVMLERMRLALRVEIVLVVILQFASTTRGIRDFRLVE